MMSNGYVDVILPFPLQATFTYSLQEGMEVKPGCRVVVSFGKRKIYTALVVSCHDRCPEEYEIKTVLEVLDQHPVVPPKQLQLWQWIADYYLCSLGEVYKAALPSGMKLESESVLELADDVEMMSSLSEKEQAVLQCLHHHGKLTMGQLEKKLGLSPVLPVLKPLLEGGLVQMSEELRKRRQPGETCILLSSAYQTEKQIHDLLDVLKKSPRQQSLLLRYLDASKWLDVWEHTRDVPLQVTRKQLLLETRDQPILAALFQKGVLQAVRMLTDSRQEDCRPFRPIVLSEDQQQAYRQIVDSLQDKKICLFHGVTSSGKTEIYMQLMQRYMEAGKQVLFLLPEIVLTAQLTGRLRRIFGERLGVYHSKLSDSERMNLWAKQLSDAPYDIIVGVRSSVFLPFRRLGLVVVDEEHEPSYKQQEPAPRYHARNVALVLASLYGADTLLGTATPSFESYYHARMGKYGLVTLSKRYSGVALPEVAVIDIQDLYRKKVMSGPFSPPLLAAMRHSLQEREQVILFQNRRGYAPMIECKTCGWVPRCMHCDVSLTYHQRLSQLTCHYCGAVYQVPAVCPACHGTELVQKGFGTERLEEEVQTLFPEARVARMDLDTTRSKNAYEKIIRDFSAGKTDILIGTQMVSKGLDFGRVRVVGIMNADNMLQMPDFRSYERAFQMMEQVAGRAGRRGQRGVVYLQTRNTELPVIQQIIAHDYVAHYMEQMQERLMFHYPPFCHLIYVYIKHRHETVAERLAQDVAGRMRKIFGSRVLGPDVPPVGRIQRMYIRKIVLKIELKVSLSRVRSSLRSLHQQILAEDRYKTAQIYYDVDPV